MRHLDRDAVAAPSCLSEYQAGSGWEELSRNLAHYAEVVRALDQLQGGHCAYCECDLQNESASRHVEHFQQRSRSPSQTFDWTNLFRSCSHKGCCGKHKDSVASTYDPVELVKPDTDNPRHYLEFRSDGSVGPRPGLTEAQRRRAEETIRVFNLAATHLVNTRKAYLAGPRSVIDRALREFADSADINRYIDEIADGYRVSAFSAAILDLLGVGA